MTTNCLSEHSSVSLFPQSLPQSSLWQIILDERSRNYELRDSLINIKHRIHLYKKGWMPLEEIEKQIDETLNERTLVYD